MEEPRARSVAEYFSSKESRWGYETVLNGIKHYGYYPAGSGRLSVKEAQYLMIDRLRDALSLPGGSRVLDAGCGEGQTAMYLAEKYGYEVTGVDLLRSSVEKAIKSKQGLGVKSVSFNISDYSSLDFEDEVFDGIYTLETLVHAVDHQKALREFWRVLKSGGRLVLVEYSIPPRDALAQTEKEVMDIIVAGSAMSSLPHFTHGAFPKILENSGFSNVAVEDISSRVMPMVRSFYQLARFPYRIIKALGLRHKFVNTTAGYEIYKKLQANKDFWRWNIVTGIKDSRFNSG